MLRGTLIAFAAALAAAPALAEGAFADGSEAKEWGLLGEEKARFSGRVVDVLCEVTGECAPACGAGRHPLGVVRDADGALVLVSKNGQAAFSGAVDDLLPYCGEQVEVDGLLVGDPELTDTKVYMVQKIREKGGDWADATRFTRAWAERYPDAAKGEGPWFRKDPRVLKRIEEHGYLGLGLETDEKFKEEWF